jgi:hypothetical protein
MSQLVLDEHDATTMKQLIGAVQDALIPDAKKPSGELWPELRALILTSPEPLRRSHLTLLWTAFNGHPETTAWCNLTFSQITTIVCSVIHINEPPFKSAIAYFQQIIAGPVNTIPADWMDDSSHVTYAPLASTLRDPPHKDTPSQAHLGASAASQYAIKAPEKRAQLAEEPSTMVEPSQTRLTLCSKQGCLQKIPSGDARTCPRCPRCCSSHGPCALMSHMAMKVQAFHEARPPLRPAPDDQASTLAEDVEECYADPAELESQPSPRFTSSSPFHYPPHMAHQQSTIRRRTGRSQNSVLLIDDH